MFAKFLYSAVLLLYININTSFADDDDPTLITLPYGQIKGQVLQTGNGNYYYAFQEIPYAAPPVNRLRFQEPVAPSRWYGILNTTRNTKICHQLGRPSPPVDLVETEDCLYLNVYAPASATDTLPVLVWIHGGGFTYGEGIFQSYGPQFLIDYDLVVVSINYRLGVLGFLTTEDGVIPGNLGLKDQNFALQWVKQNIQLFGGDPEKVTIAGESAGGSSVGLHIVSKKSAGLFRGGILESGSAVMPVNRQPFARYLAFEVGRTLDTNFTSEDSTELLSLLQSLPAADITHAAVISPWFVDAALPPWRPVVEDGTLEGAFITGPMHEDIKNANINQVPILIGFNSEEYLSFIADGYPNFIVAGGGTSSLKPSAALYDGDLATLVDIYFNMTDEDKYTAGSELRKIYTDGTFEDNIDALVRYVSDSQFTTPSIRQAELESNYTDVYLYEFSYNGLLGREYLLGNKSSGIEGVDPNGVGHAEELYYLFDVTTNTNINRYPARDRLIQSYLLKLWTNFVKYLNPTPTEDTTLQSIIWPKVTPDSLKYLNINSTLSIETDPKEYKKWKEIIDKYAIPPLIIY